MPAQNRDRSLLVWTPHSYISTAQVRLLLVSTTYRGGGGSLQLCCCWSRTAMHASVLVAMRPAEAPMLCLCCADPVVWLRPLTSAEVGAAAAAARLRAPRPRRPCQRWTTAWPGSGRRSGQSGTKRGRRSAPRRRRPSSAASSPWTNRRPPSRSVGDCTHSAGWSDCCTHKSVQYSAGRSAQLDSQICSSTDRYV